MEKINGIIYNGKVYKAVKGKGCKECAFNPIVTACRDFCDWCKRLDCAFRYSQELTDKINGK